MSMDLKRELIGRQSNFLMKALEILTEFSFKSTESTLTMSLAQEEREVLGQGAISS